MGPDGSACDETWIQNVDSKASHDVHFYHHHITLKQTKTQESRTPRILKHLASPDPTHNMRKYRAF